MEVVPLEIKLSIVSLPMHQYLTRNMAEINDKNRYMARRTKRGISESGELKAYVIWDCI
ncbi:hypothetical protein Q2T40_04525 [Winogradskyella maritima]|nr:hypothetical protein [Winogradskyella maritima]